MPNLRNHISTLPGSYSIYGDGNLGRLTAPSGAPTTVIFGTAQKGNGYQPQVFTEDTIDSAIKVFGASGTIMRQIQELRARGIDSVIAVRICAESAYIKNLGADAATVAGSTYKGFDIKSRWGGEEFSSRFLITFQHATASSTQARSSAMTGKNLGGFDASVGTAGELSGQAGELSGQGASFPLVTAVSAGDYYIVTAAGTPSTGNAPATALNVDDVIVSDGAAWQVIAFDDVPTDGELNRLVVFDSVSQAIVYDNLVGAEVDLSVLYVENSSRFKKAFKQAAVGGASSGSQFHPNGTPKFPEEGKSFKGLLPLTATTNQGFEETRIFAGGDGLNPSRMKLMEGTMQAFQQLEGIDVSYIMALPGATLDCPFDAALAPLTSQNTSGSVALGTLVQESDLGYPLAGSSSTSKPDKLAKVYIEEMGEDIHFYWDVDGDNQAEYWSPTDGGNYATVSKGGHTFGSDSFLEPNFAYMYAYFCHRKTFEESFCQSIIGVEPPKPGQRPSQWLGSKPQTTVELDGTITVISNGSGLLGNKYMAGAKDYRNGKYLGGFIESAIPYFEQGAEVLDVNDLPTDMGKYITIWVTQEQFTPALGVNNNRAYSAISPAAYGAFRDNLAIGSSPTQKAYPARPGIFTARLTRSQQADLSELRYTYAKSDFTGIKIVDAPTAARPESDYTRQGSIEIIQFVDRGLRLAVEPFLGENVNTQIELAIQQELDEVMNGIIGAGILINGAARLTIGARDRILNRGRVDVQITVPFELRQIFFTVNLQRQA